MAISIPIFMSALFFFFSFFISFLCLIGIVWCKWSFSIIFLTEQIKKYNHFKLCMNYQSIFFFYWMLKRYLKSAHDLNTSKLEIQTVIVKVYVRLFSICRIIWELGISEPILCIYLNFEYMESFVWVELWVAVIAITKEFSRKTH